VFSRYLLLSSEIERKWRSFFIIQMGTTCRRECLPFGGSLKWPGGKTHHPLMLATGKLNAEHSSSRTHLKKLKCQGARKCQRSGEMGIPPFHIYIHTHSRRHIFPRFPPAFPLIPHPLFLSNYRKVHRQRS